MNFDSYNFNVPAFVREADPSSLDASVAGAVVVGGYRIDNPAAAWVAGAEMRKNASKFDGAARRLIKEACSLFNIEDSAYTLPAVEPTVTVTEGEHSAAFNVFDNESLNSAASTLLSKRASLPYSFAQKCAEQLGAVAKAQGLEFGADNQVAIRKLAGDYNVDFVAGKKLLESVVTKAKEVGMVEHADILQKMANLCTPDSTPDMAPLFIYAIDEFNRECSTLRKAASDTGVLHPENVFYISNSEYAAQRAEQYLSVDSVRKIKRGALLDSEKRQNISKWASICGYSIGSEASAEDIVSTVGAMPSVLRDEFIEAFA